MKHLMLTTALATATAFGAMAQTATDQTQQTATDGAVPAFLSSEFTGKSLYTLDTEDARALGDSSDMSATERDRMRWTSSDTFLADRDNWTSVGSIDNIVMTKDGEIRGVLVDVGGFLGFGARTVMVDIDELHFVTEEGAPEDIDDFFVVIAMSQDELETLPEWDADRLRAGFDARATHQQDAAMQSGGTMQSDTAMQADRNNDTAGAVFGDDHRMLEAQERTADRLMGASVHDAQGENIGSVEDVVLGTDDTITDVLVDVGGFLGMGAHTVLLPIEEARIGWNDADGDVRVQLDMTREQLEALPAHEG